MSNILQLGVAYPNVGLDTMTYTIPTSGIYNVKVQCLETPVSGISIVVNQNGSPVYTSVTPSPTQSAFQFKVAISCTAADVITVVISSSTAIDQMLNTVKTIISIGTGM